MSEPCAPCVPRPTSYTMTITGFDEPVIESPRIIDEVHRLVRHLGVPVVCTQTVGGQVYVLAVEPTDLQITSVIR